MKTNILILFALLTFSIFSIAPIGAFPITIDSISQTAITWNLSQKGELSIMEISLDGVIFENYNPNITRIVQSGLKPDEEHIISVTASDFNISELSVRTEKEPMNEETGLFTLINLYALVLISLLFVLSAIFTRVYFLAFIGTLFSITGIIGSLNNNFITGWIFGIMLVVSFWVGFNT